MKYIDPRFVILIFGYVLWSEFLSIQIGFAPLGRGIAAFSLMILIYWFPDRMKADFINWIGGSTLAAIGIYLAGGEFAVAFTILLLTVFFLAYVKNG